MPIIRTVSPEQASGTVAEIYRQIEQAFGRVPHALQMYSASPRLLEEQWRTIGYFMNHPTLGFPLLTMIRMLVSQHNRCDYCVGYNEGMLINRAGLDPEQVAATKRDPANAPLNEKDRAMLLFVLKATAHPADVAAEEVQALREMGWADGDILDAVAHGARNVGVDLIFNTFKIENDF